MQHSNAAPVVLHPRATCIQIETHPILRLLFFFFMAALLSPGLIAQEASESAMNQALGALFDVAKSHQPKLLSVQGDEVGVFSAASEPLPWDSLPDPGMSEEGGDTGSPWDPVPTPDWWSPSRKSGAADIIASEVFYQMMAYYGVEFYIGKKQSGAVEFRVISSKNGYFRNLRRVDVTYALKEMSRYLVGHMCNEPTAQNLYKLFVQVPPGKLGVRFMYDMAWATLGNALPRDPNPMFQLNSHWKVLNDVVRTSGVGRSRQDVGKVMRTVTDLLGAMRKLGKIFCFVDLTPDPRVEYVKRNVVKKLLQLQRDFDDRADHYRDLLDVIGGQGDQKKLESLNDLLNEEVDRAL